MHLTHEQIAIIQSRGDIKINAVAGSGKTTTLIEYAKARQGKGRILYIAFNKSVKLEAQKKFAEKGLDHVRVETAHSLAYNYIVKWSAYKVKKEGGYKTTEIAEILGLNSSQQKHAASISFQRVIQGLRIDRTRKNLAYGGESAKRASVVIPDEPVTQPLTAISNRS